MPEYKCDQEGISAFRGALQRSVRYELWQELRGRPADSLPFDVVSTALHLYSRMPLGLHEVPTAAIVGSVDRAGDFTRNHLPRKDYLQTRWCRVYAHVTKAGFDPISVFKVSDIYFVNDGNHRLSVLSSYKTPVVEADVTEFACRVRLGANLRISDLARKAAYAEFLEQTNLDHERPAQDIDLSYPASYRKLEEHIAGHAFWMEYTTGRKVSVYRAAASWYDLVYHPTIELIRNHNLLRDFRGLREADLYVGATEYHRQLARGLGRPVPIEIALEHYRMTAARPRLRRLWYLLTSRRKLAFTALPMAQPQPGRRLFESLPTRVQPPASNPEAGRPSSDASQQKDAG
jgi:hypothetical protein